MNDVVIKIRKNSVVPPTHYLKHLLYDLNEKTKNKYPDLQIPQKAERLGLRTDISAR